MAEFSSTARGSIPDGYREVFRWNLSQLGRRVVLVQTLAGVLFVLGLAFYLLLAVGLGRIHWGLGFGTVEEILTFPYRMGVEIGKQLAGAPSAGVSMALQALGNLLLFLGGFFGLQLVLAFLHEGVHGLAMRFFGARPAFGFLPKGFMFYATSPGYTYPRVQYFWVAIAPLVVLDILFFLALLLPIGMAGSAIVAVLAALNTGGAVGDLWILAILRRFPSAAYVMDEKDGMRVFLPEDDSAQG